MNWIILASLIGIILGALLSFLLFRIYYLKGTISLKSFEDLQASHHSVLLYNGRLEEQGRMQMQRIDLLEHQERKNQEAYQQANMSLARETAIRQQCQDRNGEILQEMNHLKAACEQLQGRQNEFQSQIANSQAQVTAKNQLLNQQQEFIVGMKAAMEQEFRLIANTSLDLNANRLSEQQQIRLLDTLAPFQNQLDAFRKQVDEKFSLEADGRNTLKGELHKMLELNQTISKQTENLTTPLTRQSKQQGGYGEEVLESILLNAGMLEGEHYYRQFSTRNEDGLRIQPDILIRRPEGLSIVIDSKVSLTHYVQYCEPGLAAEEERRLRKEIYNSFKAHVDSLSAKKYDTVEGTADFILMFTPAENAYTIATNHDSGLRQYAFARNVFVVTPSSLLLVIRMIFDLWQKDRVNKEVQDIANRARDLYEKACGFLESFSQMGEAIGKASQEFEMASKRLSGHGGLVRQGEMLKQLLGTKTNKKIPAALLMQPEFDEQPDAADDTVE